MPQAPRFRTPLLTVLATAAVLGPSVLGGGHAARADGPAPGTTVVGTLVHAFTEHQHEDPRSPTAADAPLSFVKTPGGNAVRVPTTQVTNVPTGATVSVRVGNQVVDKATTTDGLAPARQVLAASVVGPAPPTAAVTSPSVTPVTDQVTVVMAVPRGGTQNAVTLQQVVDQVNGPVADFWSQQSGGAIHLGVTGTVDWYQASVDCSDPYALWNEAASRAAWTPGPNKHLMVYLPTNSTGCAYGLAEVGTSISTGGELYVTDVVTSLMAHELGHNFGLGHSSEIQCDNSVDTGSCQTQAYRDYYDVMAASWDQVGSLTVGQAARIGLLPAGQQQTVTWPGPGAAVTLAPVSGTTGTRALKLVDPNGKVYWLEYRPAAGQDAWLGTAADWPGLQSGVLLRENGPDPTTDSSLLLDGTPSPQSGWPGDIQTALPAGQAVTFDYGMFTVTVDSTSGSGAAVRVSTGPSTQAWTAATNKLPIGNLDVASVSGTTVTAAGWGFDPDAADWPSQVHVYVDGIGHPLTASGSRPDIGAAFPPAGSAHGFTWSGQVSPGMHTVCAYGIDYEIPSAHSTLGCRQIAVAMTPPVGVWDSLQTSGTTVSLAGWAFDPDSPQTTDAVHLYVDGAWGGLLPADQSRPDIGQAFPVAGGMHGFGWSSSLSPGVHTLCLYAIDNEIPSNHTTLGCRRIALGLTPPLGIWDSLQTSGTTVSLAGWAFDPDSPQTTDAVHLYVDGAWGGLLPADQSRPDIGQIFPAAGGMHGFSWSASLSPGVHTLCLYAIDNEIPSNHTTLGCRAVAVAMTPPLGIWDSLQTSGTTVSLAGWAFDPDSPAATTTATVSVDGAPTAVLSADQARPDVGQVFPAAGALHGFGWSGQLSQGVHTVCVSAVDNEQPSPGSSLGCRTVTVPGA